MNLSHGDRFNPGGGGGGGGSSGGSGNALRASRSRFGGGGDAAAAASPRQSSSLLLGGEHPSDARNAARNSMCGGGGQFYHEPRPTEQQRLSAFLGGAPPGVLPRSISPDSFGEGPAPTLRDPLHGDPPQIVKKPPPPSLPGAFAATSTPGAFASAHDAVSQKVAQCDNQMLRDTPIEIAPGITARLRGAKETWAAVEADFHLPTTCICCNLSICCIMDANFVLCPECKVVSPMDGCSPQGGFEGGVGLGFTFDQLQQWQGEIIRHRRQQRLAGW